MDGNLLPRAIARSQDQQLQMGVDDVTNSASSKTPHPKSHIAPECPGSEECWNASRQTTVATQLEPCISNGIQRTTTIASQPVPLHSIFTLGQKRFIVFMASWAGFFSPVSANIYFPALNTLALDLGVSNTLINLTLTSYMIFQGLAPAFIGSLTDSAGRRPAYIVCFIIYIVANIGLALQNNYAALFVLRCLQSTGSSATIAMASAVVADVSTPAERGSYMGFTLAGSLLGPAIGPIIGGVLAQFLGWRAIFWFLVIFAGTFLAIFGVFFPETARSIVGDGSIAPRGLNMSLMNYLAIRKAQKNSDIESNQSHQITLPDNKSLEKRQFRFPNPLSSLRILWDKQNALLLLYNAFLFAAFYDITAIIPSQFARIYHFNDLQIGLCYIPFGFGSMCAALVNGQLLDRNFQRWCSKLGVSILKGRDQDLREFPIERARLQLGIPAAYLAMTLIIVFGWVLNSEGPLPVILVLLFFISCSMTIAFNVTSTLLVDFYPARSATATAANNLVRCLLGAAATGLVVPMVEGMGLGWTFTFLSLFLLVTSPMLWLLMSKGMKWREERRVREASSVQRRQDRKSRHFSKEEKQQSDLVEGGVPEAITIQEQAKEKKPDRSNASPINIGDEKPDRQTFGDRLHRALSHHSVH